MVEITHDHDPIDESDRKFAICKTTKALSIEKEQKQWAKDAHGVNPENHEYYSKLSLEIDALFDSYSEAKKYMNNKGDESQFYALVQVYTDIL